MSTPELAQEARDQIRTAFDTLKRSSSPRPRDFVKAQKLLAAAYRTLQASATGERPQAATETAAS